MAKKPKNPWTPFERCYSVTGPDGKTKEIEPGAEHWRNSIYQVELQRNVSNGFGFDDMVWLSIKSNFRQPRHDWREFQRIKNELCGEKCDAVEIYPAESRLHDTVDQFHLWVFPPDAVFPLGFLGRFVGDAAPVEGRGLTGSQRKFSETPADAMTSEDFANMSQYVELISGPIKESG